ncbi:copper resistance protein B [Altererythrobacter sp. H2]|uniref:copper resistance protein B n=1 Tax=Altererythrobacter sp. H2 TaxID=3108391 RepID=UPI002B4BAE0A|nr:copper resistance protein B [Altererythrobacter sp. H2]WRK95047.1 copper resistance protein B [Altererythrobacter sp. H2]
MIARITFAAAALSLLGWSVSAVAQDHSAHQSEEALRAESHEAHQGHAPEPSEPDHSTMNHDAMNHGSMNHADMNHAEMNHEPGDPSPGPTMETPAPPEAGSGPPRAADAIWGAAAMQAARDELRRTHGDFATFWFQADRFEAQFSQGSESYLWDLQGYYGGPTRRFWFKSEGEGAFGGDIEEAGLQALYSAAIDPFWDVQAGVRQDFGEHDTTYGVLGVQGLAPYMFEIDAAVFLSHRGDITAKVEAELDQRITQRLIIQPRAEVQLAAQDVPELGIGAGLDEVEAGVRLRYEITREFAPYIGVEQSWRTGRSARLARAAGEDSSVTHYVVGVRFWF